MTLASATPIIFWSANSGNPPVLSPHRCGWPASLFSSPFPLENDSAPLPGCTFFPLALFFFAKGREYYLAPAYPSLFAAGAVFAEGWLATLAPARARRLRRSFWSALAVSTVLLALVLLPIAPLGSHWWFVADKLNGNFNEEIGWPEMVATVAQIRDSLPPDDHATTSEFLPVTPARPAQSIFIGRAYGLPDAISGSNSNWFRGYGDPPPQTAIVIGFHRDDAESIFVSCQPAGHLHKSLQHRKLSGVG